MIEEAVTILASVRVNCSMISCFDCPLHMKDGVNEHTCLVNRIHAVFKTDSKYKCYVTPEEYVLVLEQFVTAVSTHPESRCREKTFCTPDKCIFWSNSLQIVSKKCCIRTFNKFLEENIKGYHT